MKQWLDFIPLVLFLITFMILGIFPATGVLIASTVLLYGYLFFSEGRLEKNHKIMLVVTLVFGGLTLALHNEAFLKWKAPIVNWALALVFLGSHFIGDRLAVERMMGHAMTLPVTVWRALNLSWVVYFITVGAANFYVAFHYEAIWVYFKVASYIGFPLIFIVLQMLFIHRYLPHETVDSDKE